MHQTNSMDFVRTFIDKHGLPEGFCTVAEQHYVPLCQWVEEKRNAKKANSSQPLVLGINGAQGTGKSTLADFIAEYTARTSSLQVAVISIDDLYLTKADRNHLAETVHPLLATRGVPGTHDLPLALDVMEQLLSGASYIALPRFDKSVDDRLSSEQWPQFDKPVDLVILEGWCVGSVAESAEALQEPANDLESAEDATASWRSYVNECLAADYQKLFGFLDHLILLKAPDFEAVYRWRLEQEEKLAAKAGADASGVMNAEQIARFIQHYERLTRYNLSVLPQRADKVLELDQDHQVV